jgi:hypothetical protein
MTDNSSHPTPKNTETDPPAANQPLGEDDLDEAGDTQPTSEPAHVEPKPTPVPVAAPHGGQIAPGKPDGEVDTRP